MPPNPSDAEASRPPPAAGRGRTVLVRAALVAGALAAAAGAGEAAVRILYGDRIELFPRYHTDYRYGPYRLRGIQPRARFRHTSPDGSWTFTTNNRGFRDTRDFPHAGPPGVLRVLSLGDSHTQGYEVGQDATFSAVLERHLAAHGVAAEVLNAGVSGFGTAEALALLEHEGHRYHPHVVVLGFFANDFGDNLKAGLFGLDGAGRLVAGRYEHLPGVAIQNVIYRLPLVPWLSENSYLYSMVFNAVWAHFKARLHREARQAAGIDDPFERAGAPATGPSEHETALAGALIERMADFCAGRGLRFILVDIPRRTGPRRFASSLPPALRHRLDGRGIEYVFSEALLEGLDGAVDVHVPRGAHHISEITHALIGAELGRRILTAAGRPASGSPVPLRPTGRREYGRGAAAPTRRRTPARRAE